MVLRSHLIVFLSQEWGEVFLEGSVEADDYVSEVCWFHFPEQLVQRENAGYHYTHTRGRLTRDQVVNLGREWGQGACCQR